jgi:hypothetical protein
VRSKEVHMKGSNPQQLSMYVLAASVSLVALTQPSHARIIYTPANVTLSGNGTITIPQNGGAAEFTIQEATKTGQCFDGEYSQATVNVTPVVGENGVVGNDEGAATLSLDAPIGPSQSFDQTESLMSYEYDGFTRGRCGAVYAGYWCDGSGENGGPCYSIDAYLGLEVEFKGRTYYGWAHVLMSPENGRNGVVFSVQLKGYAYETNPGQSINAGQTSDGTQ